LNIPADLKYTKSHEWVRLEGEIATIGITDFAQSEMGDIVYVDLPSVGKKVGAEETFGSVDSVKTVSELFAPVAGEIVEVNGALGDQADLLNKDPYGEGWLVKMRTEDAASIGALLDHNAYKPLTE
jgi:glycine cleavage system H protein